MSGPLEAGAAKAEDDVQTEETDALVVGGGPAGLMAAEALSAAGRAATVVEAMPSVGRKFLMAGKSGLNLTREEAPDKFVARYGAAAERLRPMLESLGQAEVQEWAWSLGQELFTGSTGRVFPSTMKASPLLRAWLGRLAERGVEIRTRWRWTGGDLFLTPDGPRLLRPRVTVLALGGASWRRLGSDGAWTGPLGAAGVPLAPFRPANVGLAVDWSPHMALHFGAPVKGVALSVGATRSRGEIAISRRGLEGGGIYPLIPAIRDGAPLTLDLCPDVPPAVVAQRLDRPRGKATLSTHLRKALRLDPAQLALLREFGRPLPEGAALATLVKALPVRYAGPRPLDEAISVAGGVMWEGVDPALMLGALPGVFVAGEMLDWEAPTGGYLLTACLATGLWAGVHAARWTG
ncbi:TIGR03862 family flavoprotein [Roseitranquillus sediminis]|uniref:TIGR03862 family flavoprotein n=1 Tax=Roseitranquillus sediminis TaxID=2809051 RepID=UPI001D0BF5E5|nr:TIGR03862 family flavoprotein [Roseitranquillus sediminis]MBM9596267.1 TIGR03862 family flavoprotein [Roseitranquillus sediminis]